MGLGLPTCSYCLAPYVFQLFFQPVFCWLWCHPTTIMKTRGLNEDFSMSIALWLWYSSLFLYCCWICERDLTRIRLWSRISAGASHSCALSKIYFQHPLIGYDVILLNQPCQDLFDVNCFPAKQQLAFCSKDEGSLLQSWQLCGTFTYTCCERWKISYTFRDIYCVFWLLNHNSERFNCSNRWCG